MQIRQPYLLFLGDAKDELAAKTAFGIHDWIPETCIGQFRFEDCAAKLPIAELEIQQAVAAGVKTLVIGVTNAGGFIPDHWIAVLKQALESGLDIASGLHQGLGEIPELLQTADQYGRQLLDVRHPKESFAVGSGKKRSGKRVLSVGTDCSVGKMYTSLAINRELRNRGLNSNFRATGQTGIFIAGAGISVDAVIADFISGSVESIAPAADESHWDIIEGQGSLFHPSFAGVSLGLLHGSQADILVLCHEPTRRHMRGLAHQPIPGIAECIEANLAAARLVNAKARVAGIAVNSKALDERTAQQLMTELESTHNLPCVDPVRSGVDALVDAMLQQST